MSATPIADMVEAMLAKDTPADVVVLAVRTIERSRETQRHGDVSRDGSQRSPGAIRSARWRAKRKQIQGDAEANDAALSGEGGVTPECHAQRHGVTPPNDSSFFLSEGTSEEVRKKNPISVVERGTRGTRLTADWQPSDDDRKFARDHGLDPEKLRAEFVDYWTAIPGQRGCKTGELGWSSTWRNRVRELSKKSGGKNAKPSRANLSELAFDLADQARDLERQAGLVGTDAPVRGS